MTVIASSFVRNGSVWLSPDVLRKLGCQDGEEVEFILAGNAVLIRKRTSFQQRSFSLEEIVADTYASTETAP